MLRNKKGFTLIELLVVLAVIGIVGTAAAIAVNSARAKQRDATRLSHIRQIQSALEDYFIENNSYPAVNGLPLGTAQSSCLDTNGFQPSCDVTATNVLIRRVPATLTGGLKGLAACGGAANAYCYYVSEDMEGYGIIFELEKGVPLASLIKGPNCATSQGIKAGPCTEF